MANPQKENGFTPIANEILEHICKLKLNGTELKLVMAIWRCTYGFSKKSHFLSLSFLSEFINSSVRVVTRELAKLEEMRIIYIKNKELGTTRIIEFNKNYDEWVLTNQSIDQLDNRPISPLTNQYQTIDQLDKGVLTNQSTKKEIRKKKNNKEIYICSFNQFWSVYPRKESKQTALKAWEKLKPDELLQEIILKAVEIQKKSEQWTKNNGQFIPHASTWLNQKRWEDEIPGSSDVKVYGGDFIC